MQISGISTLRGILAGAVLAFTAMASAAADAPLNTTQDGIAMDGFDVIAYFEGGPAKGDPANAVTHAGATWLFSSPEHAAAFEKDPAKFAPQTNGWCAYAVSQGYAAEVDFVNGWSIIDGKLFLNYDANTSKTFQDKQKKLVAAAEANWPTVAAELADGSLTVSRHADDPDVAIRHPQQLN